jgi:hypothetical protein
MKRRNFHTFHCCFVFLFFFFFPFFPKEKRGPLHFSLLFFLRKKNEKRERSDFWPHKKKRKNWKKGKN